MYNSVYIYTDGMEGLEQEASISDATTICITHVLDIEDKKSIADLTAFYYNGHPVFHFAIALGNAVFETGDVLNDLAVLFSHPLYMRTEAGIVLFVFEGAEKTNVAVLDEFFKNQGYQKSHVIRMNASWFKPETFSIAHVAYNETKIVTEQQNFETYYARYLAGSYDYDDFFFFKFDTQTAFAESIAWLKQVAAHVAPQNAYIYKLVSDVFACRRSNALLTAVAEMRKNEITILNDLFAANARNNEIEYILKFYQNEYEVLPLWYKRFGHILKAISGKRSWRSLFTDDEKQY